MRKPDTALFRIVAAVQTLSGLSVPIAPRVLACLLGRQLVPVICAVRVRTLSPRSRSRRLMYDALQMPAAQHRAIAAGCAEYIRHHYGAGGAGVSVTELALALCGRY